MGFWEISAVYISSAGTLVSILGIFFAIYAKQNGRVTREFIQKLDDDRKELFQKMDNDTQALIMQMRKESYGTHMKMDEHFVKMDEHSDNRNKEVIAVLSQLKKM